MSRWRGKRAYWRRQQGARRRLHRLLADNTNRLSQQLARLTAQGSRILSDGGISRWEGIRWISGEMIVPRDKRRRRAWRKRQRSP